LDRIEFSAARVPPCVSMTTSHRDVTRDRTLTCVVEVVRRS
jgi:hypothetical protein